MVRICLTRRVGISRPMVIVRWSEKVNSVLVREKYSRVFCQGSVRQRQSSLLFIMISLRMGPLVLKDRELNSASLRYDCV